MDSLWGNIFKTKPLAGTRALLKRVPMFSDLNRRELAEVEKILYRRTYAPDEVIFRQGDPGVGMYVIERGSVAVIQEATDRTLASLRAGEFFGEIALLNETPRSARAVATTAAVLHGLFQAELYDLVQRNPRLGTKLLLPLARNLGSRLLHADERLQVLHDQLDALGVSAETIGEDDDGIAGSALD